MAAEAPAPAPNRPMFSSRPSDPPGRSSGSGAAAEPASPPPATAPARGGASTPAADPGATELERARLIADLDQDRLWLLRQIDAGRWAEWRLDLAALERELGQLLDQLREHRDP